MKEHEILAEVGFGLYGGAWREVIAIKLNLPVSQVRRFAAGTEAVPLRVWDDLVTRIAEKREALKALRGKIEAHTAGRT